MLRPRSSRWAVLLAIAAGPLASAQTPTFVPISRMLPRDVAGRTNAIAGADVDGDGDIDLLFGNGLATVLGAQNALYVNEGTGRFRDATSQLPAIFDDTRDIVPGDVDGDGDLDAYVANGGSTSGRQHSLLQNDGAGNCVDDAPTQLPPDSDITSTGAFGDVDGDGDLDLLAASVGPLFPGQDRLLLNDGAGFFVDASV